VRLTGASPFLRLAQLIAAVVYRAVIDGINKAYNLDRARGYNVPSLGSSQKHLTAAFLLAADVL